MGKEVEPRFASFRSTPEELRCYENDIIARVFLPFSDLHWLNLKRVNQLRETFLSYKMPPSGSEEEDGEEKDEEGNLMPGNIQGKIYRALELALPLARLNYVRQIPLLAYSSEGERNYASSITEFPQMRINHTFLVARILESVLGGNGFSPEKVNLGITAGLIHDLTTPAFGDATKGIDPEALSEEKSLERLLDKYDLSALIKFGIEKEKVMAIVRGEGTLGYLLDVIDKIAYTAVDVYHYAGDPFQDIDFGLLNQTIEPIRQLLQQDPRWANIYQEIKQKDGQVYFEDPQRLGRFLELRARMHKALYLNPHCRGRQLIFRMLMQPLYSREPNSKLPFNQENLLLYTDGEVEKILDLHWGIKLPLGFALGILPDYRIAQNSDLISGIVKDLEERGLLPLGAETIRNFNPGVDFLTLDCKRLVRPYSLVRPEHAQSLRAISTQCNQTVVYYWPEGTQIKRVGGEILKPVIAKLVEENRQRNNGQIPHAQLY